MRARIEIFPPSLSLFGPTGGDPDELPDKTAALRARRARARPRQAASRRVLPLRSLRLVLRLLSDLQQDAFTDALQAAADRERDTDE
jgi:hypothetical protein